MSGAAIAAFKESRPLGNEAFLQMLNMSLLVAHDNGRVDENELLALVAHLNRGGALSVEALGAVFGAPFLELLARERGGRAREDLFRAALFVGFASRSDRSEITTDDMVDLADDVIRRLREQGVLR